GDAWGSLSSRSDMPSRAGPWGRGPGAGGRRVRSGMRETGRESAGISVEAGRAEPTGAPDRPTDSEVGRLRGKFGHLADAAKRDRGDDELRDAHPVLDGERRTPEVDERDLQLAAVVGVDRPGRVGDGDAVLRREPRAGAHLALVPFGNRDRPPGGDERDVPRREGDRRVEARRQVEPGREGRLARRKDRALTEPLE